MLEATRLETRMRLICMAMTGVVDVTIVRNNGTLFKMTTTLLPNSRECATTNADLYYKSIGTTRYKVRKEKKSKREKVLDKYREWEELLERSLNLLFMVDIEEFRWKCVPINRIVDIEWAK